MPAGTATGSAQQLVPVMIWIHDPTVLVARSASLGKPIIVVTLNYRLNMFSFGDGTDEGNLALKDQRRAIEFVKLHITPFGGDPDNMTIAGESAGAVYCHAHAVMGVSARQCILQSGTLYLSPPRPKSTAETLIRSVSEHLAQAGGWTLRTAPVSVLLEAQRKLQLESFYLQMEEPLEGWQEATCNVERVLIGDTEYESVLWRNGIETLSPSFISDAFDLAGEKSAYLKRHYGIVTDRPVSCKLGALDLLHDARFSWPIEMFIQQHRSSGRPAFRFLVDQPNPWQTSSRPHHGVDLVYLFGGFDFSFDHAAQRVSAAMQERWITFVHGHDPWEREDSFAFGPVGECKLLSHVELAARRRVRHFDLLRDIGQERVELIVQTLAAGRSSLLN
ncbi:hypothetical protein F66182_9628 [Fusarium sp. NRRL 66182]|nr:hypothetical protein F66182_9628 [Fusarium sp. NRRL 66182]